ncbi:N-acetyltransferase [Bifidobacterium jacchi]|uniref:N-acetyltransferase n=1 Tax=Bifidobacterium jacchi TaxID=2490545 RepID=A0A5N5RMJ6_9BIFI|nr:N-acetyltransferase [Bifidobacterium jacchi]
MGNSLHHVARCRRAAAKGGCRCVVHGRRPRAANGWRCDRWHDRWHNGGVSVFHHLRAAFRHDPQPLLRVPSVIRAVGVPDAPIMLRPLAADDEEEWCEVRWRNDEWLSPWESGDPMHGPGISYNEWMQRLRADEQAGRGATFVIEHRMRIVGQISLGAICYGSMRTGTIGYWMDERCAGHGFAPLAVAMLADWAMHDDSGPRLHRLEIAMLPVNDRSRRVAEKVGAAYEGMRRAYMYVNGEWRDHRVYALLAGDAPRGFAARLMRGAA